MKVQLIGGVFLMVLLSACSGGSSAEDMEDMTTAVETDAIETTTLEITTEATTLVTTVETTTETTTGIAQLNGAISAQPAYVQDTKFFDRSAEREECYYGVKKWYCDYISPVIVNNSGSDIKDVKIAYAAWDANDLPVKIECYYEASGVEEDESYIAVKNLLTVNIPNGGTYEYKSGDEDGYIYPDDEDTPCIIDYSRDNTIAKCRSIVVSYTDYNGNTWENPYYEAWRAAYEGKKLVQ